MAFLGIDLGSSSIKFGRLDRKTLRVDGMFSIPFPEPVTGLGSGEFEVEPAEIVESVRSGLQKLDPAVQESLEGIVGSCQMGGLIAIDAQGKPLTRYVSWRDQRAGLPGSGRGLQEQWNTSELEPNASAIDVIRATLSTDDLRAIGNELRLGSMLVLAALLVERGEVPPTATPLTLGDYVLCQLAEANPATEQTCALGTLDLRSLDFAHTLFDRLGMGRLNWPTLVPVTQPIGHWRLDSGRTVPWYPFVGDHQASLLGVDLAPGDLSINVSTGSQVAMLVSTPEAEGFQVRPFFQNRFLRTITHLPAGRALQAWVDLLAELAVAEGLELKDPWQSVAELTEQADRRGLGVDLTLHDGPPHHHGSVTGITLENLRIGSLFAAAFEDMADRYHSCAAKLTTLDQTRRLVLSGGLVRRFPRLRSAITQRFPELPVIMPESTESALDGLARLAAGIQGVRPRYRGLTP